MKHLLLAALLISALFLPISAGAAPTCVSQSLSAYITLPAGCSIDGLLFSGFRYFSVPIFGDPALVPADEVTVNPILQPRPGLSFLGNWNATGSIADHLIFYEVRTLSGLPTISDAYLDWSFDRTGLISVASLDEFLCLDQSLAPGGCDGNPPLRFYLRSSIVPGNASDHISFAPVAMVGVLKDVFVDGVAGSATISRADNQWGQVPEPGSIVLTCCGVLGLGLTWKYRRYRAG